MVSLEEMKAKQEDVIKARETQLATTKAAARLEEDCKGSKKRRKSKKSSVSSLSYWILIVYSLLVCDVLIEIHQSI